MKEIKAGMLARSLAGHDKDSYYVIQKLEADFAWLVDGKTRTLEKPKKKKLKHLQLIKQEPAPDTLKDDPSIRRTIRSYRKIQED